MIQAAAYGGLAALQLAGGYFASQNIKATAKLNRDIADMNAEFAELDAYDAEMEGHNAQTRYQGVIDKTLAEQKTVMEAQGIDSNFGSAASVQAETKFVGQLNLMEIQKHAQEQALGYRRQGRDYSLAGALGFGDAMFKSGQAMFQGIVGAAQSGLSGYKAAGGGQYTSEKKSSGGGEGFSSGTIDGAGTFSGGKKESQFTF